MYVLLPASEVVARLLSSDTQRENGAGEGPCYLHCLEAQILEVFVCTTGWCQSAFGLHRRASAVTWVQASFLQMGKIESEAEVLGNETRITVYTHQISSNRVGARSFLLVSVVFRGHHSFCLSEEGNAASFIRLISHLEDQLALSCASLSCFAWGHSWLVFGTDVFLCKWLHRREQTPGTVEGFIVI